MSRTVTILCIAAALAAAGGHYLLVARGRPAVRGGPEVRRWSLWERLLMAAVGGSFGVLAVTGFLPVLGGEDLTGWLLVVHVAFGGVFSVAGALAVLRWAEDCRFEAHDRCCCRRLGGEDRPADRFDAEQKAFFWIAATAGLAAVTSMMASMVNGFGSEGIELLAEVHRYSALLMLTAGIGHLYRTAAAKPGARGALFSGRVTSDWARRYHRLWWDRLRRKQNP